MSFAVEMLGVDKRFGDVHALKSVQLQVESRTIHAVVGENGAGKTTLMRILYGAIAQNSGRILLNGQETLFPSSAHAISQGIGMVSQHYSIIPELTNLQNLILGSEGGWTIKRRATLERADALANRMGFSFKWTQLSSELSPSGAQKLEILKLLWREAKILILDEPTAMLSPADSNNLFKSLRQLTEEGATVILVTHLLPEVMAHCDAVTVLRNGANIWNGEVSATTISHLGEMIVGHPIVEPVRQFTPRSENVLLALQSLEVRGYRGDLALKGLDLEVAEGEILGIAGVDGNGQRELVQALTGELPVESGTILWKGQSISSFSVGERLAMGFRLVPQDRHQEAIVESWSLEENAALGLQRFSPFAANNRINLSGRREAASAIAERFGTQFKSLSQPISSLSGGNQQRFVASRALYLNPQLIIAFQPTRGLDFDATQNVFTHIRDCCRNGACAVVISFDLDQILEQCDSIAVMYGGCLRRPPRNEQHDRDKIGSMMVGAA